VLTAGQRTEIEIYIRAALAGVGTRKGGKSIMTRRTALTGMSLLGLAIAASSQLGFAQGDPLAGLWQLNLSKSRYNPGPAPKSLTVYFQGEGQSRKITVVGINGAGNPITIAYMEAMEDGKPHPVTGLAGVDASAVTRVDGYSANVTYFNGGKPVQTGTLVTARDGKSYTFTISGTDGAGRQINNTLVLDRQ
jgi:hypothetical protein